VFWLNIWGKPGQTHFPVVRKTGKKTCACNARKPVIHTHHQMERSLSYWHRDATPTCTFDTNAAHKTQCHMTPLSCSPTPDDRPHTSNFVPNPGLWTSLHSQFNRTCVKEEHVVHSLIVQKKSTPMGLVVCHVRTSECASIMVNSSKLQKIPHRGQSLKALPNHPKCDGFSW
jgi:hypothetical protein